ncbi:MAG: exonuclease domain-containing protein, partial [Cyanobacteria bacterium J06600_6]
MDFIVIDTEGRRELKEIAIIDRHGRLIYEAFNQAHNEHFRKSAAHKPLKTILMDFRAIAIGKLLVFHNAEHDLAVLAKSFERVNLPVPNYPKTYCTYREAKQQIVSSRYSLEYLAKKLNLKVDGRYFNCEQAHIARYDALFTHKLYLALQHMNLASTTVNPFGSSRVDNPFQTHPDNTNVYQA